MCGRFALTDAPEEVAALFGYLDVEDFPPRYNIAPTQPIAIVRQDHGKRQFALARWGLVPAWVEEPRKFQLLINARSDSLLEKPAFKNAARYRRCLVPASGFYEWRRQGKSKQPFWVHPAAGGPMAFAGLWETWSDRDGGETDSACIVTTAANQLVAPIHARMPVVVAPEDFERWLTGETEDAMELLRPAPEEALKAYPVSDRVNKAEADDPGLLLPVTEMKTDLFG
jgi:putative SOS response-associated peptidase YedK